MMNTNQDIKIAQYYFYPTMNCSLSCDHCFIEEAMRHDKKRMSVEQFKIVVDKYAEHFVKSNIQNAEMTIMGGNQHWLMPNFTKKLSLTFVESLILKR
ncbi:hypothetical protein EN12_22055 [Vibrio cholerae]|nr:hypothetical protein EN12_22055 [Vibrio cholerae]